MPVTSFLIINNMGPHPRNLKRKPTTWHPNHTFHTRFVGRDGSALDTNIVLQDGVGRIKRHLIVSLVTVGEAEIIVQALNLLPKNKFNYQPYNKFINFLAQIPERAARVGRASQHFRERQNFLIYKYLAFK